MTADEEPKPFEVPDATQPDGGIPSVLWYIAAALLMLGVLILLVQFALGRPGCTKQFKTWSPTTQPQ